MKIEQWNIERVIPYARNPRINDLAVVGVVASIKEFGFRQPIVVDKDGVIIAGHTRHKAAIHLGLKEVPVHVADTLTPQQVKAYRILDNKVSEKSEWDNELLLGEIEDLPDFDFSSFDVEFDGVSQEEPDTTDDEVPEVSEAEPVSRLGDVWLCGRHRVMCGDATNENHTKKLLTETPTMMVTDPPYGVNLDQSWRDKTGGGRLGKGNANLVKNDDIADWGDAWKLFTGDVVYVWHAGKYSDIVMNSLREASFEICQQIIWNKSMLIMGRSDYHFKHEPCWYAVRKGKTHNWIGDRKQTTVIDAASPNRLMTSSPDDKTEHPTQKPIACMTYLIKNHSGDVYDPFLGSGTTLIACERLNRTCYGCEISPKYVDVICRRYFNETGIIPKLEATGENFPIEETKE